MENRDNTVFTEMEINATPEEVWQVLTDWERLKEWSSSFIGISTEDLEEGQSFTTYFKNPITGDRIGFERVCIAYEKGRRFGWSGSITHHGTTDHHIFSVEPTERGTTIFKQEDGLHGPHSKFFNFLAKHKMTAMYKKFDKELKIRVESLYPKK